MCIARNALYFPPSGKADSSLTGYPNCSRPIAAHRAPIRPQTTWALIAASGCHEMNPPRNFCSRPTPSNVGASFETGCPRGPASPPKASHFDSMSPKTTRFPTWVGIVALLYNFPMDFFLNLSSLPYTCHASISAMKASGVVAVEAQVAPSGSSRSATPQCSTIWPASNRHMSITVMAKDLPVGGRPMKGA